MPVVKNIWPFPVAFETTILERLAVELGHFPGYCCICGKATVFRVDDPNFRENVPCRWCGSVHRQRVLGTLLLEYAQTTPAQGRFLSLHDITTDTVIWNAEAARALHVELARHLGTNYVSSEYIDPALVSGETRDGLLHVDMQRTHFDDEHFNFILSSEVIEHVPEPLEVFRESHRILKQGGCHIFTAPFYQDRFTNERRAMLDEQGRVMYLRRPWYHVDPRREADGALVYNVFAPELMCEIEAIGFQVRLCLVRAPFRGLFGWGGIGMVAQKLAEPNHRRDGIFPDDPPDWPASSPPS